MENLTKRKQSSVENAKREAKDMRIESRKDERSAKKSERSMVLINNLYEDIHMEFQNLQLQVFFFYWGGGGVRLVTIVVVPLKTKARLAELRNNLALRKWCCFLACLRDGKRVKQALTANGKLKCSIFLESMKPV